MPNCKSRGSSCRSELVCFADPLLLRHFLEPLLILQHITSNIPFIMFKLYISSFHTASLVSLSCTPHPSIHYQHLLTASSHHPILLSYHPRILYTHAFAVKETFLHEIRDNDVTVLLGETGSGKTTRAYVSCLSSSSTSADVT
jgi:type IV secretory pathway VirB4 component